MESLHLPASIDCPQVNVHENLKGIDFTLIHAVYDNVFGPFPVSIFSEFSGEQLRTQCTNWCRLMMAGEAEISIGKVKYASSGGNKISYEYFIVIF